MENLNKLMFDKLSLIYNISILLENSDEKEIDLSVLFDNNYTTDDMLKIITGLLMGESVNIEKKEIPSKNIELIEKAKKDSVSDLYTEDLENPFFSSELLEKLLEYRLEGLPIQTLINPNLKVEDLNKMLSYYIHTKITPIYDEILYMSESCIAKLIANVDEKEENVIEFLQEFRETRLMMITKIEEYMTRCNKLSEKIPSQESFAKVYSKNKYKKNN